MSGTNIYMMTIEYGFQSMPSFSSIRGVCGKSDWHPLSPFWIQVRENTDFNREIIIRMECMRLSLK